MVANNQRHYFTIDNSNKLRHFWREANGTVHTDVWSTERFTTARPAAILYQGIQMVYAVNARNQLVRVSWSPGRPPRREVIVGGVTGSPSLFAYGSGAGRQLHVFVRTTSNRIRHVFESAGRRDFAMWASGVQGRPVAFVEGDQQHVFFRCQGGAVCHWWWSRGQPARQDKWSGAGTAVSDVTGFSTPGQQHVFFRTTGQRLQHIFYDRGSRRLNKDIWPGRIAGTPHARAIGAFQVVVAKEANTNRVAVTQWNGRFATYTLRGAKLGGDPSAVTWLNGLSVLGQNSAGRLTSWGLNSSSFQWSSIKIRT